MGKVLEFKRPEELSFEDKERLIEIGRDLAYGHIKNAVSTAKDSQQMSNQLFALKIMAYEILAQGILNNDIQLKVDPDEGVKQVAYELGITVAYLYSQAGETDTLTPGDNNETKD